MSDEETIGQRVSEKAVACCLLRADGAEGRKDDLAVLVDQGVESEILKRVAAWVGKYSDEHVRLAGVEESNLRTQLDDLTRGYQSDIAGQRETIKQLREQLAKQAGLFATLRTALECRDGDAFELVQTIRTERIDLRAKLTAMTEQRDEAAELLRDLCNYAPLQTRLSPSRAYLATLEAKAWAEELNETAISTDAPKTSASSDTQATAPADDGAGRAPSAGALQAGQTEDESYAEQQKREHPEEWAKAEAELAAEPDDEPAEWEPPKAWDRIKGAIFEARVFSTYGGVRSLTPEQFDAVERLLREGAEAKAENAELTVFVSSLVAGLDEDYRMIDATMEAEARALLVKHAKEKP